VDIGREEPGGMTVQRKMNFSSRCSRDAAMGQDVGFVACLPPCARRASGDRRSALREGGHFKPQSAEHRQSSIGTAAWVPACAGMTENITTIAIVVTADSMIFAVMTPVWRDDGPAPPRNVTPAKAGAHGSIRCENLSGTTKGMVTRQLVTAYPSIVCRSPRVVRRPGSELVDRRDR